MPTVSVCISNLGSSPLGPTIDVYSFPSPGFSAVDALYTGLALSGFTGNSCPYNITVPEGTTSIRLRDPISTCSVDLPVQSNNICINCNFGFTNNNISNPGRLTVGELSGSCQNPITDYRIFWYGPDNNSQLAFISGKGTSFTPYNFTHPLTGSSAVFTFAGSYKPVVDKVRINNITYSQTATTGSILGKLDCLSPVSVSALTCDNGTNTLTTYPFSAYTHRVNFLNATSGLSPLTLRSTFELKATTNFFAYKFRGFTVNDTLRISFSGSAYTTPIVIENIQVGEDAPVTNFNPTATTKSFRTSSSINVNFFQKVLTLTGLTTSSGDTLLIEVIPNSANTQTNWDFYFTCLTGFSQNKCTDNNPVIPYKIISSSVTGNTVNVGCGFFQARFVISGCSLSNLQSSDPIKYMTENFGLQAGLNANSSTIPLNFPQFDVGNISCGNPGNYYGIRDCASPKSPNSANTITYNRSISGGTGFIKIDFANVNDFNAYLSSWNTAFAVSGNPYNNLSVAYYRYAVLRIPRILSPTQNCGDGQSFIDYNIHFSTTFTTGTTATGYTLTLTQPTITNGLLGAFGSCSNCDFWTNSYVNGVNSSATATTVNFTGTTITGNRLNVPFWFVSYLVSGNTNASSYMSRNRILIPEYANKTLPMSGNPLTLIPSLSGQAATFTNTREFLWDTTYNPFNNFVRYYEQDLWVYRVVRESSYSYDSYDIYTSPYNNFTYSGWTSTGAINYVGIQYMKIGTYSANTLTIIDSNYFV